MALMFVSMLLLLAVNSTASAGPGLTPHVPHADTTHVQHAARVRRGLLDSIIGGILNPFNVFGHRGGRGSGAHSDSANVGATLPFGISAGISTSSANAHSDNGGPASAESNSGGGGYPQNYGGSGAKASIRGDDQPRRPTSNQVLEDSRGPPLPQSFQRF